MNIIFKAFFSLRFNFIRSGKVVTMDCVEKLIRKDMKDPFTGESLKESDIIPIKVSPFLAVLKLLNNFWFINSFIFHVFTALNITIQGNPIRRVTSYLLLIKVSPTPYLAAAKLIEDCWYIKLVYRYFIFHVFIVNVT